MIGGLGLQWQASFAIITLLYFYSHYLFASGAAHIGAMYTAFLSVSIAMGTPPLVVRFLLGHPVCRHQWGALVGCPCQCSSGAACCVSAALLPQVLALRAVQHVSAPLPAGVPRGLM